MLGCSAGEHTADFTGQGTLSPELASGIRELAHLTLHVAEAGGRAEDNGICRSQFIDGTDRYMRHLICV
jgi:hypothetical protein